MGPDTGTRPERAATNDSWVADIPYHYVVKTSTTPPAASQLAVPLPAASAPGIYVHVPFCGRICPYCDFNTYAGQEPLIPAYVDAVTAELNLLAAETVGAGSPTLYFGGGTPSLLSPAQIERIIHAARQHLHLRVDAEVSMEANPETLDTAYLRAVRDAGVNRLSLGVQSQQRAGLRVLGRGHSSVHAGRAVEAAREAGFDNISLDFIYGWPGQQHDEWEADLRTILDWQVEHVSLYSLIVEPGTPMQNAVRRGILTTLDDDTVADFYDRAVEVLAEAGWEHYEISNWAREPRYRSRHNQIYWQNGQFHGTGAGAYGTLGSQRVSNLLLPKAYIEAVESGRLPRATSETISPETAIGETMMLGLRLLVDGVSATDFHTRHGLNLRERFGNEIDRFVGIGLLEWQADRLRLTPAGSLVANEVAAAFLP